MTFEGLEDALFGFVIVCCLFCINIIDVERRKKNDRKMVNPILGTNFNKKSMSQEQRRISHEARMYFCSFLTNGSNRIRNMIIPLGVKNQMGLQN